MKAVLLTTKHRGVFFGYIDGDDDTRNPVVADCRNVLWWDASVRGFLGLAANGPNDKCRIGPAANVKIYDVTSVADVTPAAEDKFKAAPWSS